MQMSLSVVHLLLFDNEAWISFLPRGIADTKHIKNKEDLNEKTRRIVSNHKAQECGG